MKTTGKLAALLLTIIMLFTLTVGVSAADNGSITITNAVENQTYTIYRILGLESYNSETGAYAYKATAAWSDFINSTAIKGVYVSADAQGYVTWVDGADAAAFAKLAQAYAVENNIDNQGSAKATGTTLKFENLDLGYYLVDTTLGTLCSLSTTKPDAQITEKNEVPTNVKTVQEDSTGAYSTVNDADIGQTVYFKSTITAQEGAENYVFHDKMSAGLTYNEVIGVTLNGNAVDAGKYTVVSDNLNDGCTFEVRFSAAFCGSLNDDDIIVISYTATVNANAVIGGAGNPNESSLEYGQAGSTTMTPPSETRTYTWDLKVLKYGNGDESHVLSMAKFVLLNKTKDKVAIVSDGKLTGWADLPGADGTWPENAVLITGNDGRINIAGLDADTYYLREIKAPDGYNTLSDDISIVISPTAGNDSTLSYTTIEVKINNQSGAELPSTGGIGTTIFYIIGAVLVLGASVLLVTKRRMNNDQ